MIYFLIPMFNEEKNLNELHANLTSLNLGEDVFFVFSDDGSTDNSKTEVKRLFPGTSVILGDGKNYGPGNAFNIGFEWILGNAGDTDKIVTLEADNTSDPSILSHMLTIADLGYPLVLASVYAQGGGFDKTSFLKRTVSSVANILFRYLFDLKVQTLSSFYRVYHVKLIKEIKIKYGKIISENGFLCMLEILLKAIRVQHKVIEVPMMLHSSRRKGKSNMKVFKTTMQYFSFLLKNKI